ncbi:MAG: peptidoglycan DD-metalloendopeptidase family protein [Gammaproteobacteria bacterium]|nr:peptidoglycan DD-metalloendopeptidase family protein [Gammaproteobacteria bacterium]
MLRGVLPRLPRTLYLVTLLCALAACQSQPQAPIERKQVPDRAAPPVTRATPPALPARGPRPAEHVVVRGDTLHAIAWRYGLDYRDLVRWNGIRNPDLIIVGQRLRLTPPRSASANKPGTAPPRAAPARTPGAPAATPARPPARTPTAALHWQWPTRGKVTAATSVTGTRGLEIRGKRGQEVKAAAAGSVVYSGSGLRGYGELIIVKHDETFLSAYAHNETRLVQEGQHVEGGQLIARMGNSEARDVMLHFEIRRNGKSVDPYQYLPKR